MQRLELMARAARRRRGDDATIAAAGARAAIVASFSEEHGAGAWEDFCESVMPED